MRYFKCSRYIVLGIVIASWAFTGLAPAASLPGLGELSGRVKGTQGDALAVVFAHNRERDLAYIVYVVDGQYRATNVMPGEYDVTVRPAVGQLKGFAPQSQQRTVKAGTTVRTDFAIGPVREVPNYVGGMPYNGDPRYPDGKILPYDEVYPPGRGREILERTCNACHAVNFIPYNVPRAFDGGRGPKDRAAWTTVVDLMHKVPAFGRPGKAPIFDPALLPAKDREILIDYLAANFGPNAEPRVVQLDSVPSLDGKALSRAMFIEYNYHEPKGKYPVWGWPHQVDFDRDGNVWLAYTACCIVRFDPRTGESKAFEGWGGGHGIAVDQTDGTVWYSGDAVGDVVRRLDPATGRVDRWRLGDDKWLASNTQIFDSQGNLWMSLLAAGGLAKWDRKSDSVVWWDVPVVASRPYGIIVDNHDKVWFSDYHNGGVTRFDPDTEKFKSFPLVKEQAASNIRRLGVDSKDRIWTCTWASIDYIAKLYRLDPQTGEVMEKAIPDLPNANCYNTEPDTQDNIWLANSNYLSKYDQRADRFIHYPIPVRSDTLKTTITRDDGVWFFYRNAGKHMGYGGTAVVLYPDKDGIRTLGAYHSEGNQGYRLAKYSGSLAPPVRGGERISPAMARNAVAYAAWAREHGLLADLPATAPADASRRMFDSNCRACHTLERGAADEIGPNLAGVFDAKAGSKAGFAYSAALLGSGIVWDQESLTRFIASPSTTVPGTTMAFLGVADPGDQAALVALLRAGTQDAGAPQPPLPQQVPASQRE